MGSNEGVKVQIWTEIPSKSWSLRCAESMTNLAVGPLFQIDLTIGWIWSTSPSSNSHSYIWTWPIFFRTSGDHLSIRWFPEIGLPPVIIHLQMDFPWNKPSIGGTPWLWKPPLREGASPCPAEWSQRSASEAPRWNLPTLPAIEKQQESMK